MFGDWAFQTKMNQQHRDNPVVGDHWTDNFSPVAFVLAVNESYVRICRAIKPVGDGWTWDADKAEWMLRSDFAAWLSYQSAAMSDRTWAEVTPQRSPEMRRWRAEFVDPSST